MTLPSPGGMRELSDFVGEFAGQCLERDRPLWKAVVVDGLEGGKNALVMKIHHAAMDGGQSATIASTLLDTSLEGRVVPPPGEAWIPDREPTLPWLAADALRTLVGKPRRAVEAAAKVVSAVRAKGGSKPPPSADGEVSEKAPLFEAPPTPFNGALTPNRSVAFADVSLEDVKTIKRAFGTTVNDVVLAACCASLRSWLAAHGGLPERPLVATVPVSVRQDGDQDGNRVSVIRVHLPIQSDDPVGRLMAINEETTAAKRRHRRGGGSDILKNVAALINNITVPWMANQPHRRLLFQAPRRPGSSIVERDHFEHRRAARPSLHERRPVTAALPAWPPTTRFRPRHHSDERGRPAMFRRNGLHGVGPRPARHRDWLRE